MKGYLLLFAALFSANAMASKARVGSLLGADHLIDTQTVFTVPSHVNLLNPYMTFEFGAQGAGAEGGIMRKVGGGNLLVYVGHQNTTATTAFADFRAGDGYETQNNPVEVIYGTGNMGFGVSVSRVDNDTANTKETTLVGKFGMNFSDASWMYVHAHLISEAEQAAGTATDEISMQPYLTAGVSWAMGTLRLFGDIDYGTGEENPAVGADDEITDTNLRVGVEDRSLKTDAADIYYGVAFDWATRDREAGKVERYALPVFLGIEAPVLSWVTVRASVQQNFLIGESKDETPVAPTPDTESGINDDTTVAAGLGFKHGNFVLDGSLTAAGNGNINGSQFLSQASITYNF